MLGVEHHLVDAAVCAMRRSNRAIIVDVLVAVDAQRHVDMEVPGLADHADGWRAGAEQALRPGSLSALRPARRVMPKAAKLRAL